MEQLLPPGPGSEVALVPYDEDWPAAFARERDRIRAALVGAEVHHVGSTSVPGLVAKPVLDLVLVVDDPADEAAYVPALVRVGLALSHREPEWFEHRLLKRTAPRVNLHVFGTGCPEVARMLAFRDRLRDDPGDRALYARVKRGLAERTWPTVQDYADTKTAVVAEIMTRAEPPPP
ncbi:GrpB family protein [Nocardioides donggukensis]|uniref:GrpB family protein n=1 Tax=Nocardioides donggukensis TaxID=2774019 RepID=A0A927K2J0_9ACTN|nr:GrpB family protein [Nocardioides donggukensis]MBD8868476.1 GrpB family protein [Nocardioides donggukensis]